MSTAKEISDIANVLGSKLEEWRDHPAQMVEEAFGVKPDAWQAEALEAYPHVPRLALKACAGPGKSAVLAWMGYNFLITRKHPIIGATSITGDNLKANFWTELARWREKCEFLKVKFEMTKTEVFCRDHPKTWKIEGRTWAKDADDNAIGNSLRGLHAEYIMWLLDETGDYPNAVMRICENIFSGSPVEAHIAQAGNPTKLDGPLYRAAVLGRDIWKVIEITGDPDREDRSPRISIEHAREQIKQYGRDDPYVMINILGQFPPSALNALIGPEEVRTAMGRYYRDYEIGQAARVMGVDVASEGDDQSVIYKRQGLQSFPALKYRNINSTQGAGIVAREWTDWNADGVFVDNTGGFGAGWIDQLMTLRRSPIGVGFATEAHQKDRYFNKRAEMYFDAVAWIKRGGALIDDPQLLAALTSTTYAFKGDRLILEPKIAIKKKLGYSPDIADALVLTFAEPVNVQQSRPGRVVRNAAQMEYNPFADIDRSVQDGYGPIDR